MPGLVKLHRDEWLSLCAFQERGSTVIKRPDRKNKQVVYKCERDLDSLFPRWSAVAYTKCTKNDWSKRISAFPTQPPPSALINCDGRIRREQWRFMSAVKEDLQRAGVTGGCKGWADNLLWWPLKEAAERRFRQWQFTDISAIERFVFEYFNYYTSTRCAQIYLETEAGT